jgi:hypothetical protein
MTKTYTYDSDYLAEAKGLSSCPEVKVYIDVNIDDDQYIDWSVAAIYVNGEPMPEMTEDALEELGVQILKCIEADDDIYGEWAAHKMDEAAYRMEDR